jgi:hypothetical protein
MVDIKKIPLTSSEISGLWSSYMGDTLIVCMLKHCLSHADNEEIRALMQQTFDLSTQHIQEVTDIFNAEKLPIPDGYTDRDVFMNAPRLFSDGFYLQYLGFMARVGMHNYTLILNELTRADIRDFFTNRIHEYIDLYNNSAELRLSAGIFIRAPRIEVAKEVQFIKSQDFMSDRFGEKRSMLTVELTHVFSILFADIVGRAITTGFGQVSKEKKNSKYFFDGKALISEQMADLDSLLPRENIPIPSSSDSYVTDSTIAPFSEKLMLNHSLLLISSGLSSLGMAIADTMRKDLQVMYKKFTAAGKLYAKEGADILIENGWPEQPPQAVKHENLVGVR